MSDEEIDESEEGGGKGKLIIIIVIVLLLLVGIVGGAMMFLGGDEEVTTGGEQPASELEEEIQSLSQTEEVRLKEPKFTPPKSYTVNLRDGKHFLSITISAALEDEMALLYLAEREPIIDDMIISLLQDMTTEDLRNRGGMELLKREIFKKVNGVYDQDFIENSESKDRAPVKKVLITKFVLN